MNANFLLFALVSFAITLLTTPVVILLATKYHLIDNPRLRKHPAHTHTGIVPRAGGLSIFIGLIISCILFLNINKVLLGIIIGTAFIVVIGILDDKFDLSPYLRFITNFLAAAIVVAAGVGIPYITNPVGGTIRLDELRVFFNFLGPHSIVVWADLFALIWIVWCTNIVNWSKGVDGQMPGFVVISAITIGILSLRYSNQDAQQINVTALSFITAGAFLGFLPWNFYPQKIMPGYSGGALAGFLLAILSILSWGKLGTAILVLGIPMIDAAYTVSRRLIVGRSPFWGDRGHLHHKLLDLGWGRRRISLFYWSVSAILGLIALNLTSQQKLFAFILLFVSLGGVLLWLSFFTTYLKQPDQDNG